MSPGLQRGLLLGGLGAVLLAVGAVWFFNTFERRQDEIPLPPRGEAAYNPLYALKRTLQLEGAAVQSQRRLSMRLLKPAPGDTIWLMGDLRTQPPSEADELLQWVSEGGHLVVAAPRLGWRAARTDPAPLLDALGVTVAEAKEGGCVALARPAPKAPDAPRQAGAPPRPAAELCGNTVLLAEDDDRIAASWGDRHGDRLLRIREGEGSVDVLTDLDFATNTGLRKRGAAALARQLLAPNYRRGTVHLVYDADMPPLWKLLLEQAWMAWLPLLLALLGWLWWRTQRRGPLLPSPQPLRRALIEHVQASGEHVHRYGRGHLLHQSLRALFDTRLQRRDPYAASLEGEAQRKAIAARTGLTPADVDAALRAPVPFVAADLRLRIARLNRLRLRL